MADSIAPYLIADPDYFERPEHYAAIDSYYLDLVRTLLPADWPVLRYSLWYSCAPPDFVPRRQGWKIHVSSTLHDSRRVLERVTTILVAQRAGFKFVVDPRILHLVNSKGWERGHSGKFITIYP